MKNIEIFRFDDVKPMQGEFILFQPVTSNKTYVGYYLKENHCMGIFLTCKDIFTGEYWIRLPNINDFITQLKDEKNEA